MSDTPRTDEFDGEYSEWSPAKPKNWPAFTRKLERELNAANERIKRLERGGDEAIDHLDHLGRVRIWTEAKEAKL
jgi:uncharacterized protein YeaO (DUF488 family)